MKTPLLLFLLAPPQLEIIMIKCCYYLGYGQGGQVMAPSGLILPVAVLHCSMDWNLLKLLRNKLTK